jgi:putative ATP-dependent endonuclease of OLD family
MRLPDDGSAPHLRVRLTANLDSVGEIEQRLEYVLAADADGVPLDVRTMSRADRQAIHVHYLPARRNPADHVSYAAGSLVGRLLRAADWSAERATVTNLGEQLGEAVVSNEGVAAFGDALSKQWSSLHKGEYYTSPGISFGSGALDQILRQVSVSFGPGHGEPSVAFSRLSDGQQSLFYLSMVLTSHTIGAAVIAGTLNAFDIDRLRPPVFTLMAVEEPENSLSPHYLGRAISALRALAATADGQALVATHAPSILRRAEPEEIRYLRLSPTRQTTIRRVTLPEKSDEAHKFVREAVMAFPEVYFSRLVVLGEGDSEEIVLPRLLAASGVEGDGASVCVAPLGGRHVQHFWRLLHGLSIPYITLLDLDLGRYDGGWGRIKVSHNHLRSFPAGPGGKDKATVKAMPKWDDEDDDPEPMLEELAELEKANVFFSAPVDLDLAMLNAFPAAYGVTASHRVAPDELTIRAVLGKSGKALPLLGKYVNLFDVYHDRFKLSSKPASHLDAMAKLDDKALLKAMPERLRRLVGRVVTLLKEIPE